MDQFTEYQNMINLSIIVRQWWEIVSIVR